MKKIKIESITHGLNKAYKVQGVKLWSVLRGEDNLPLWRGYNGKWEPRNISLSEVLALKGSIEKRVRDGKAVVLKDPNGEMLEVVL